MKVQKKILSALILRTTCIGKQNNTTVSEFMCDYQDKHQINITVSYPPYTANGTDEKQ